MTVKTWLRSNLSQCHLKHGIEQVILHNVTIRFILVLLLCHKITECLATYKQQLQSIMTLESQERQVITYNGMTWKTHTYITLEWDVKLSYDVVLCCNFWDICHCQYARMYIHVFRLLWVRPVLHTFVLEKGMTTYHINVLIITRSIDKIQFLLGKTSYTNMIWYFFNVDTKINKLWKHLECYIFDKN